MTLNTTRWPNGVTNVAKTDPYGIMPNLSPLVTQRLFYDFQTPNELNTTDWTLTESSANGTTQAVQDLSLGILKITTSAEDDSTAFDQLKTEQFTFESGKPLVFVARSKVSQASQSDWVMGLQVKDTTPLAVSDGAYFLKADGSTDIKFVIRKSSVGTSALAVDTMDTSAFQTFAFRYDGASAVQYYVDGVHLGTLNNLTTIPSTELTLSMGFQTGSAESMAMYVDYIGAEKVR